MVIDNNLYEKISDYLFEISKDIDLGNSEQIENMQKLFEIFLNENGVSWEEWYLDLCDRIIHNIDKSSETIKKFIHEK